MLAVLLNGPFEREEDANGHTRRGSRRGHSPRRRAGPVFVDRDPTLFRDLLEYLRHNTAPPGPAGALRREFHYFGIPWLREFDPWHCSGAGWRLLGACG